MNSTNTQTRRPRMPRIRGLVRRRFNEALTAGKRCSPGCLNSAMPCCSSPSRSETWADRRRLKTLDTLERHHPRFSRLHEERGHCFVALRQAPQAIEAFQLGGQRSITRCRPAGACSKGSIRMTGQAENCAAAASQVATLRKLPPRGGDRDRAVSGRRSGLAEPMVRAYLLNHGDEVEAMRLLARIGMARKVFDDAELLLAAVLELAPDYRGRARGIRRGAH